MNCRDIRDLADSFLSDELLTETNHEILRHLDTCPSCHAELALRRQLRQSLRVAFDRAPELQPRQAFVEQLREQLRQPTTVRGHGALFSRRWLMLAAGVLLTVGLAAALVMTQFTTPVDALARDAIGDHWNCALRNRKVRTPVPLEEAAQRFDAAYRALLTAPPDEISTPNGSVRVTERHSCAFGTRRFGHVVLQYRQHVVSLLVTADHEPSGNVSLPHDLDPRLHGKPVDGFSVASIHGARHAILLVSDLDGRELRQLATTVSVPLVDQLVSGLLPPAGPTMAMLDSGVAIRGFFLRGM